MSHMLTPKGTANIDGTNHSVWIADDEYSQSIGLERELNPGGWDVIGMLFVFQGPQDRGFQMSNTLIPLDIAWFDVAGACIGTASMLPLDSRPVKPAEPYQYALEVPRGILAMLGIVIGSRLLLMGLDNDIAPQPPEPIATRYRRDQ